MGTSPTTATGGTRVMQHSDWMAAASEEYRRLGALLAQPTVDLPTTGLRGELADQAALLLGRWSTS